ncbi:tetratricopeptide repeat protein [Aeoliella mucimassa]|uniref:Uncharacterized protein n=1 Tax=Aeoliella mucimassa TaxID=2527972 RepID=A0A518AI69_9BACT|nr:hypothetical protein [Aeoliella mucimassa]QDU54422.1 hypothetical protein Pan181_06030 [Aeoliella mucimassa]
MQGFWRSLFMAVLLVGSADVAPAQLIRTAPDIKPPANYQPGTGVDRNGIMRRPSTSRTTNYVVPGGGYYYGWSPGGYYYYGDSYYYGRRYYCPYCGSRWCNGSCYYNRGPIVLPPAAVDGGQLFGPRAAQNFLGVGNNNANNNNNAGGGNVAGAGIPAAPAVPPPVSNPTARAQAWKFVEYGDRHFKKGNYREAAERYEKASGQAADIADVYFRQAFAELGLAHYSEAVSATRRGLSLDSTWPESGFVLEELYPDAEAKRAVFRQLHTYLNEHEHDADARFMLSVLQHFDGQTAAAEVGFRRVVDQLGPNTPALVFLPPPEVAQQPQPAAEADAAEAIRE